MPNFNVGILGGGWAGLLVAKKLTGANVHDIAIIETAKLTEVGGLLRSEIVNGFTFDCGGPHLLFSKDENVLCEINQILGANSLRRSRNNFVFFKNQYIQYPFENGIYQFPPEERVKFIQGIIERMLFMAKNKDWKPDNFLDWITGFFGESLAEEYLIPYNKKIWKRQLNKMAADWVFSPGRLPFPELNSMLLTVAGIPNVGYKEQAYFYYPNSGGISALYNSLYYFLLQAGVNFVDNERVSVITKDRNNYFEINGKIRSKRILSTIPLPELLLSLDEGDNYKVISEKFDYNSVVVVGVAIDGKTPNHTAVYVPDPRIIFHRYTWMSSLISPTDNEKSNLIAEVTIPKGKRINLDTIVDGVVKGLIEMGVIEDYNSVLFTKVWFNRYGYPIYSLNHNDVRQQAMDILDTWGIKSVGRWGSWHYWNTDMVLKAVNSMIDKWQV